MAKTDFAPLLVAYDTAKADHPKDMQADHEKAQAMGLMAPQAFTMPDVSGAFCSSWKADKALLTGVLFFINWLQPKAAPALRGLIAMGDKLEATACHLPAAE